MARRFRMRMRGSRRRRGYGEGPARELAPYMGSLLKGNQRGLNLGTVRVNLSIASNALSNGSGILNFGFSEAVVASCPAFPQYRNLYCEYRVVSHRVRYEPLFINNNNNDGGSGNVTPSIGAWAGYHENATPASTTNDIIRNPGYRIFHTGRQNAMEIRMRGPTELGWRDPALSPVGQTIISLYVPGCSPNTVYGLFFQDLTVEFRSRI